MGSEFCSCQYFLRKPEHDTNILSNSKKEFSTIDKDKRFEEESSTNEKNYKSKIGDLNSKTIDTLDRPLNYNENTKKKGLFDINNSFEKDNKEVIEKNQKENILDNPKSQFKKTFTFKDQNAKSNGENITTEKKNLNSSNNNTNAFNNENYNNNNNNFVQDIQNSGNKMDNQNELNKKLFNKEEIDVSNQIKEEDDEYIKSANDKNTKNTKNSKLNSFIQNSTNREKGNKELSDEKEIKDSNNINDNDEQKEEKINKEVKENQKITTDFLNDFLLGENNEEEKDKSEEENNENNNKNENEKNYVSNDNNDNLNYDSNSDYMYDNNNNKEEGSHSSIFD